MTEDRAESVGEAPPQPSAQTRGFPPRWLLGMLGIVLTVGVMAAVAGTEAPAVFQTSVLGVFGLLILLPAWMLGILLTGPFDRRGCFANSPSPAAYRSLVGLALGLGVFSLGTLLMGTVHLAEPGGNPWPLAVIPALGFIIGALPVRNFLDGLRKRQGRGFLGVRARRGDWLFLLAAAPVAILLIAATFPPGFLWRPNGYDVLEYHLELPREYALFNSTAPLGHNVYSFFPSNVEMLYLLLQQLTKGIMGAGGIEQQDSAYVWAAYPAQFFHAFLMLLAVAGMALMPFRETRRDKPFLHSTGRAIAAVFFLGVPWTLVTGSLAFNEGGMFLFGTLAMGLALGSGEAAENGKWTGILIGALLGLAVGCKMTAGVFFAVPVALILAVRAIGGGKFHRLIGLAVATGVACLVYAPWAIRAAVYSGGNPVFPIAASVLPRDGWTAEQVARFNAGHAAPREEHMTAGEKLRTRMGALADNSVFDPDWSVQPYALLHITDNPEAPLDTWWKRAGLIWVAVPLALFCAFFSRTGRGQTGLLAAVLVVQVLAWILVTHLQARFLLPAAVPLAMLMGRGVQGLHFAAEGIPASALRILAGTIVGIEALATGFLLLPEAHLLGGVVDLHGQANHPLPPPPIGELYGWTINEADEAQNPGSTRPMKEVPAEKVFLLGEAEAWRFRGPVEYRTVFDANPLQSALAAGKPLEALAWLQAQHVHYLYVDWSELARLEATYHLDTGVPGPAEWTPERANAIMAAYNQMLLQVKLTNTNSTPAGEALYRVPEGK